MLVLQEGHQEKKRLRGLVLILGTLLPDQPHHLHQLLHKTRADGACVGVPRCSAVHKTLDVKGCESFGYAEVNAGSRSRWALVHR